MTAVQSKSRPSGMGSFIAIFLLFHIPLFIYPVLRLCHWFDLGLTVTLLILIPVVSSQMVSRWLLRGKKNSAARFLRQMADFILGVSPILVMSLLVAELALMFGLLTEVSAAWSVIGVTSLVSILGLVVALRPFVKTITFSADRLTRPIRFVQITDVHIGSRSSRFLVNIVDRILRLEPDFVCITGDFIDAPGVGVDELASLREFKCPVYFSTGNHERYEDFDDILQRLTSLGVNVLRNEVVQCREDIQIIGIDDRDDALQVEQQLAKISLNDDLFSLLMYHRPQGLEAAEKSGIDLMISGHTHNGQIFPFHLIVRSVFDRVVGMYQLGRSRLYVSQGTGTWGPIMRVGTRAEITLFELEGT